MLENKNFEIIEFEKFDFEKAFGHIGEELETHNFLVGQECERFARNEDEKYFLTLMGELHDFGKYTKYFQFYLSKEGKISDTQILNLKQHALFGAFFYLYFLYQKFGESKIDRELYFQYMLAGFYAILKHHGDIENIKDIGVVEFLEKKIDILEAQAGSIKISTLPSKYKSMFEDFLKYKDNYKNIFNKIINSLLKYSNDPFLYKHFYSSLIASDKYKTIFQDKNIEQKNIESKLINQFFEKNGYDKPKTDLNKMRYEIFSNIDKNIENFDPSSHFYTLNSPTGSGKTFNLLNVGLKISEKTGGKIIYGLPFTSIIDQVFSDVQTILSDMELDKNLAIKHHSLASFFSENEEKSEDEDIFSFDEKKFFINSWQSKIIVTTFYQIFYTIFGNKNKNLLKFPNLQNSVFLLDEIQSTPYKYWGAFRKMFEVLAKEYNCYFVLSSATLPLIFEDSCELLQNNEKYFQLLDRTSLDMRNIFFDGKLQSCSSEDMCESIFSSLENNPTQSHLVVLNTIYSSIKIFESIKNNFPDENVIYLSTNIIPKHRKQRIQKIKTLPKTQRVVVVSTQMIEAGVDIDLDIGFRDLGPLDSIIQVLGRLNRNWNKERGILNLFYLKDEEKGNAYWAYIYDTLLRDISKKLFSNEVVPEKKYYFLFKKYFELIKKYQSNDISDGLVKNWDNQEFETMAKNFVLIDDIPSVDVFITFDQQAENILKKRAEIFSIKNIFEKKQAWQKLQSKFNEYVISISIQNAQKCGFSIEQMEKGLVILDKIGVDNFYDENIGFKIPSDNFI